MIKILLGLVNLRSINSRYKHTPAANVPIGKLYVPFKIVSGGAYKKSKNVKVRFELSSLVRLRGITYVARSARSRNCFHVLVIIVDGVAEINEFHATFMINEQVIKLNVTMNYIAIFQLLKTADNISCNIQFLRKNQLS